MILNLCILYVKKLKIYKEKSQKKFFVFKASEHLYFKEQGQKDIKVQVFFAPLPFKNLPIKCTKKPKQATAMMQAPLERLR